jgi:hypothetical protein
MNKETDQGKVKGKGKKEEGRGVGRMKGPRFVGRGDER